MQTLDQPAEQQPLALIRELLNEQQQLTAVEKFSQLHDDRALGPAARYRDLLPATPPSAEQQYAFEVDLDRCTGCKACVTACHNLNGLRPEETWRNVGLLVGSSDDSPLQQHVTTACHHCAEPGCLEGCPVKAYDKDPVTGIVKHLDDQCIGCQYCVLKCPYDVPKYSKKLGIVRKCDMCSDRLSVGEAPACVQACPTQAIRIVTVDRAASIRENQEPAATLVAGAPDSDYTLPTTRYVSKREGMAAMRSDDDEAVQPDHPHWPLIGMLTLSQMAVGMAVAGTFLNGTAAAVCWFGAFNVLGAGLTASLFHLGRPLYAWRAFLGLRSSWLSREIVVFGAASGAIGGAMALALVPVVGEVVPLPTVVTTVLSKIPWTAVAASAALAGLAGVFCSVMIYADCRRELWRFERTAARFFGTTVVLGLGGLLVALGVANNLPVIGEAVTPARLRLVLWLLMAATAAKLLWEAAVFRHLKSGDNRLMRGTAKLLAGPLAGSATLRWIAGVVGGIVLPAALLAMVATTPWDWAAVGLSKVAVLLLVAGELSERFLFFTSVVRARMPGSLP